MVENSGLQQTLSECCLVLNSKIHTCIDSMIKQNVDNVDFCWPPLTPLIHSDHTGLHWPTWTSLVHQTQRPLLATRTLLVSSDSMALHQPTWTPIIPLDNMDPIQTPLVYSGLRWPTLSPHDYSDITGFCWPIQTLLVHSDNVGLHWPTWLPIQWVGLESHYYTNIHNTSTPKN